ncbi:hypothetical protein ACVXHA_14380 [Escherichia coli]
MQQLASFLSGTWQSGRGRSRLIHHAISGEALWEVTSEGLDMASASLPLKEVPRPPRDDLYRTCGDA